MAPKAMVLRRPAAAPVAKAKAGAKAKAVAVGRVLRRPAAVADGPVDALPAPVRVQCFRQCDVALMAPPGAAGGVEGCDFGFDERR